MVRYRRAVRRPARRRAQGHGDWARKEQARKEEAGVCAIHSIHDCPRPEGPCAFAEQPQRPEQREQAAPHAARGAADLTLSGTLRHSKNPRAARTMTGAEHAPQDNARSRTMHGSDKPRLEGALAPHPVRVRRRPLPPSTRPTTSVTKAIEDLLHRHRTLLPTWKDDGRRDRGLGLALHRYRIVRVARHRPVTIKLPGAVAVTISGKDQHLCRRVDFGGRLADFRPGASISSLLMASSSISSGGFRTPPDPRRSRPTRTSAPAPASARVPPGRPGALVDTVEAAPPANRSPESRATR